MKKETCENCYQLLDELGTCNDCHFALLIAKTSKKKTIVEDSYDVE